MEAVGIKSEIASLLRAAEEKTFPPSKVENYCKAAMLQVGELQKEEASRTLDLARKEVDTEGSLLQTESLCKIADIRLMIHPGVKPPELKEATRLEKKERGRNSAPASARTLLPTHVKDLCLLADAYHRLGNVEKSKKLIETAKGCADRNPGRTWEYLRNLVSIAGVQVRMSLFNDAAAVLDKALKDVTSLNQPAPQITIWTMIATLFIPIDAPKARGIIQLAETELMERGGGTYSQDEIDAALTAWKQQTDLQT